MTEAIRIVGASTNNLQSASCDVPIGQLTLVVGPSGSGKSSLIFDTLYREAKRRVMAPALGDVTLLSEKAAVESISGLSYPVVFLSGPRSRSLLPTAGSLSGVYRSLVELFLKEGIAACLSCGSTIQSDSRAGMAEWILSHPEDSTVEVLAPLRVSAPEELKQRVLAFLSSGFSRLLFGGEYLPLERVPALAEDLFGDERQVQGILIDAIPLTAKRVETRIAAAIGIALKESGGQVLVRTKAAGEMVERLFSESLICASCGEEQRRVSLKDYLHTRASGACPACGGTGEQVSFREQDLIDAALPLFAGGIVPWKKKRLQPSTEEIDAFRKKLRVKPDAAWGELSPDQRGQLLYGSDQPARYARFGIRCRPLSSKLSESGICGALFADFMSSKKKILQNYIESLLEVHVCSACEGARVREEAAARRLGNLSFAQVFTGSFTAAESWLAALPQSPAAHSLRSALEPVLNLGIGYLELSRPVPRLSSGEFQRLQLARELKSSVGQLLFLFDEPSVGLHPLEIDLVARAFRRLTERRSTVVVVDHDPQLLRSADYLIELGPGAGEQGGRVTYQGTPVRSQARSADLQIDSKSGLLSSLQPGLIATGLTLHNLRSIDLEIPLGRLVGVAGRSGSGKSTAVIESVAAAVEALVRRKALGTTDSDAALTESEKQSFKLSGLFGWETLSRVVVAARFGTYARSRSTVASVTGVLPLLRELYARTTEAKIFGLEPNLFLTSNEKAAGILFKGVRFADAVMFNIEQAIVHFGKVPQISRRLKLLSDLGLAYLSLSQPARSLSSGEQQRLRIYSDLVENRSGATFYVFDEPTRGLDNGQIERLIAIARSLVETGSTVVMIEHNLSVIAACDHVIEFGPAGGDEGGNVIAQGNPRAIKSNTNSVIGRFL